MSVGERGLEGGKVSEIEGGLRLSGKGERDLTGAGFILARKCFIKVMRV